MTLKRLTIQPSGTVLEVREDSPILKELERLGYSIRHGCRRGGCGMCKVEVLAGTVTHDATVAPSVLTEDERAMGTCLSCRAIAVTDIEIRLQDEILRCFFPPWLRQAAAPTSGD